MSRKICLGCWAHKNFANVIIFQALKDEKEDLMLPPSIKDALDMVKKFTHFKMCQQDGKNLMVH